MNQKERVEKYIKEHCSNCKHKKEDLCNIKVFTINNETKAKCVYYER